MNTAPKLFAIALLATTLGACATVEKMDKPTYERLHAKAMTSFDKSNSVKYAWSTAEDALDKAAAAAKAGDWATAIKHVKIAREQSELAYKQYQAEKNAGPAYDS